MKKLLLLLAASILFYGGCATTETVNTAETKPSPFTHGNVQLTLKKGITTQAEILKSFGPPNIATIDKDGNEVWTYQKHATVAKTTQTSGYGTVILFGGSSRTSGFEQSSKTMTMIIKFDESKRIADFKSMTTSF